MRAGAQAIFISALRIIENAWEHSRKVQFVCSGETMEPLIDVNCSPMECTSLSPSAPIWQDILAQAMTGELLAAMNYTSLSEICDDPAEVADALEHAQGEQGHAAAFAAEGRKIGVDVGSERCGMPLFTLRMLQ